MENVRTIFRALGVVFILFGLLAIGGSLILWGEGFYFQFPSGVDLSLPTADIFINGPASILTGLGLWKMRKWGFAMAWFTAGFYIYASVEIFVWADQEGTLSPEIIVPQVLAVLAAVLVMVLTWRKQGDFA
jgi:hypothetical protein